MQRDKSVFNSINKSNSKSSRYFEAISISKQLNQPQKKDIRREGSSTSIRIKMIQPKQSKQSNKKESLISAGKITSNNWFKEPSESNKNNKSMTKVDEKTKQSLLPPLTLRKNQTNQLNLNQQFSSEQEDLNLPILKQLKRYKQKIKKQESQPLEYLQNFNRQSQYFRQFQEKKRSPYLSKDLFKQKQKYQPQHYQLQQSKIINSYSNRNRNNVSLSSLIKTERYRLQEDKLLQMKLLDNLSSLNKNKNINININKPKTKTFFQKEEQKQKLQRKRYDASLKKQIRIKQNKQILPVIRKIVPVNLINKQNENTSYVIQIKPKILQNTIQYKAQFHKQELKNQSEGCTFQDVLSENVPKAMENLDKIVNLQTQKNDIAILIIKQIIDKPLCNQQKKQDAALKLKIKQQKQKQISSPLLVLELLKNELQNLGRQVVFTEKADFTTELCLKSLATGYLLDRIMCTVKFEDQQTQWTYDQIASNNEKLINFQKYFRRFVTQNLGINGDNITIHSIKKGSILATFSTNQTDQLKKGVQRQAAKGSNLNKQNNQNRSNRVSNSAGVDGSSDGSFSDGSFSAGRYTLHPYFSTFNLSPQMFDSRGDINFFNQKHEVQYRGGWPYYQCVKCKRFGLNVLDKFDDKDNSWLSMQGIKGQWACAFHGVRSPDYQISKDFTILNSIMQGKKNNDKIGEQEKKTSTAYLKSGGAQVHSSDKSINGNGNESVGVGIYCTPHIQQTFQYSKPIKREGVQKQYRLIFQCRVNPQKKCVEDKNIGQQINQKIFAHMEQFQCNKALKSLTQLLKINLNKNLNTKTLKTKSQNGKIIIKKIEEIKRKITQAIEPIQ